MKLFCCYTPAHKILFEKYFLPTLPDSFQLHSTELPIGGPGDFLSGGFLACIREKIRLIQNSIRNHPGEIILWTDVDIVFLKDPLSSILQAVQISDARIFFQREGKGVPQVNTGFIVMHCVPEVADFYAQVGRLLASETMINEQAVINRLLFEQSPPCWDYLPWSFYARTHGWPPPADALIYHANYTLGHGGVGQKIAQFRELAWIRKWGFPAWLFSCVKRVPGKLFRQLFRSKALLAAQSN